MSNFLGVDWVLPVHNLKHVTLTVDEFFRLVSEAQASSSFGLMGIGWSLSRAKPDEWIARAGQVQYIADNPVEALQGLTAIAASLTKGNSEDDEDSGDQSRCTE